jgi:hypothetical protein
MTNQNEALTMAVTQMIRLGRECQREMYCEYSTINQCKDREEKRKLQNLYYNEIAATANIIRLFTGREINFQWQGTRENLYAGFALYEIADDVPCESIPCGVTDTAYSRFTGKQEIDRRIDWGKGREQGKINKIFEYIFDLNNNPHHIERYLVSEFEPS